MGSVHVCVWVYVFVYQKAVDKANDIKLQQHTFGSICICTKQIYLPFGCYFFYFCQTNAKKCMYVSRVKKKTTTEYDGWNKMKTWKCISKTTTANTQKKTQHNTTHSRSNGVTDLIWIHVEIKNKKQSTVCVHRCQLATKHFIQQFQIGKHSKEKLLCENQWQYHMCMRIHTHNM